MYRTFTNKKAWFFTVYIFIISFFVEKLWFDKGAMNNMPNNIYIICKIILLIGCYGFVYSLIYLNNIVFKRVFIGYLLFMIIMLLLVWPGIWRWDEFWILDGSKYLLLNSYQHYLTSIFYIISLMIFPFPSGVIIMQIIIVSYIIAYWIYRIDTDVIKNTKISSFIIIPFLFFPVIDSNLYPIRSSICSYLELSWVLFILLESFNIQHIENYTLKKSKLIFYIGDTILISIWRSENFYYFIAGTIIFYIIFKKYLYKSLMALSILAIIIGSVSGIKFQNYILKENIGDQNTIITTLSFIESCINNDKIVEKEEKLFTQIDQVVNLNVLKEYGSDAIWDEEKGLMRNGYSDKAYKQYILSYVQLVFKYPKVFCTIQMSRLLIANGIKNGKQFIENTETLYSKQGKYSEDNIGDVFWKQDFTQEINSTLRKNIISILEALPENTSLKILHKFTYNAIIPFSIISIITGLSIIKKKYLFIFIYSTIIIKIILLFGTIPGNSFMYWYPIYLESYVLISIYIILKIKERIDKKCYIEEMKV